ncbi:MAG: PD-(D/E)XK nuclease family protein [Clostridia bacterium]|nr:PD-(D/E)XK nuclease family protein [Clostridia bacterium]
MKLDFIISKTTLDSVSGAVSKISELSQDKTKNILVLVPETNSALIERMLLEKNPALFNVSVYSFARLLTKINNRVSQNYLSKESAIYCIKKIILDNYDKLVCFKKSAKSVGFSEVIYDTITQFKSSLVTPELVYQMIDKSPESIRPKLKDLHLIYSKYQEFLANNLLDNSDKLNLLTNVIKDSELVKNSYVFVVGFSSLTSQAGGIIENIAKVAKSVTVACAYDNFNPFAENEVYNRCKLIADQHNIVYNPKIFEVKRKKELNHLFENLYNFKAQKINNNKVVGVYNLVNPRSEVEFIAEDIFSKIKEGNSPQDFAIYCPDVNSYSRYFKESFTDFGLPYFVNQTKPLSEHPLVKFCLDALTCIRKNFEAGSVINFVKNYYFSPNVNESFLNYVKKFGINYNEFLKPFVLGNKNPTEREEAESVRKEFVEVISAFKESATNAKLTGDFVGLLRAFLDKINYKEKTENLYFLERELDIFASKVTEQVLTKFGEVLNSIDLFLGQTPSNLDDFYSVFESAVSANHISVLPLNLGSIFISQDSTNISPKTKHLYICGVTEGAVPFRQDDCGLILDSELKGMSDIIQKKIEPSIKTVNRREKQKTIELLLSATDSVTLTYPSFDFGGSEIKPSNIIDNISNLFYCVSFEKQKLYYYPERRSVKELVKTSFKIANGHSDQPKQRINTLYSALEKRLTKPVKKYLDHINSQGNFESCKNAKRLYFKKNNVSISELERFFACPMQHFVSYGLRLKEKEDASVKAVDIGNILHKVSEEFVKYCLNIKEEEISKVALKILSKTISELEIPKETNALILSVIESEGIRLCKMLYKENKISSFNSSNVELSFGYDENAVKFNNGIKLIGKIDRIDEWNNYYKIIDYKTGNIAVDPSDVYYGRKIQLICYLLAMKNYKNLNPCAVLYFPIHNDFATNQNSSLDLYRNSGVLMNDFNVVKAIDNTIGFENPKSHIINAEIYNNKETRASGELILKQNNEMVDAKDFNNLTEYVYNLCNKAIDEILSGFITPKPSKNGDKTPCNYCKLRNVCGLKEYEDSFVRKMDKDLSYSEIANIIGGKSEANA